MAQAKRRTAKIEVLIAADQAPDEHALRARLDDLSVESVAVERVADVVLLSRPLVCVWLTDDAEGALPSVQAVSRVRGRPRLMVVTPRRAGAERLAALEAGVDDVLTQPVSWAEVAARVHILLRRARPVRSGSLVIADGLVLDLDHQEVVHAGVRIHLRPKEARLLELLARHPGKALSRAHILDRVWGAGRRGDPRTVDVHVRWLRAKIESRPHQPTRLVTVRGTGYRLDLDPLTER